MKKILPLFMLIVTINAQQNDVLKSKYGSREFDGPTFDNNRTEKSVTKLPALLKSSIANSNPEFLSATSDSVYEDSTYLFNVLTNDPDPNSVTVSVASNPSWLTLTAKAGGGISNITQYPFVANNQATQTLIDFTTDIEVDNSGNFYYVDQAIHVIRKIDSDGKISDFAGSHVGGYSGDGGAATAAKLSRPTDIAFDSNGNMYIADYGNYRIRKVDTSGNISTVAGTGESGFSGDGGAATLATLNSPYGVAFDGSDNMYISDISNHRIRKVDTSGNISTVAGTGESGFSGDGGAATSAKLNLPTRVAVDSNGNMYIADTNNNRIRKVDTSGNISTVAGKATSGYIGDDGAATSAEINGPWGVEVDASGNFYIPDYGNHRIRKVDTNGIISTVAGTGESGFSGDGGAAKSAKITYPEDILFYNNSLYIADGGNDRIRKIENINSSASEVSLTSFTDADCSTGWGNAWQTFTTDNAGYLSSVTVQLYNWAPSGQTATDFNLYMDVYSTDGNESSANPSSKFSGTPVVTSDTVKISKDIGTTATEVKFTFSANVTLNANTKYYFWLKQPSGDPSTIGGQAIYFSCDDQTDGGAGNNFGTLYHKITVKQTNRTITSIAGADMYNGDNILASTARLNLPRNPEFDKDGNLYFAEQYAHRVRKIDTNGVITTVAGNGTQGYSGDGGAATSAQLNNPRAAYVDAAGNIYISDRENHRIRKVDTNGIITTFAGTGVDGYSGDGGAATSAKISFSYQLTMDSQGSLYFADSNNQIIRKIDTNGIITTIAGTPESNGDSGDGGAATSAKLNGPLGVAFDTGGNLYIGDYYNETIRKVDTSGNISTIAGTGTRGYTGDGGLATAATLFYPSVLTLDKSGNIYFCDSGNEAIRKIWKSGIITTIAGTGVDGYSAPSTGTEAHLSAPFGVVLDSLNNLYITDSWNYLIRKLDTSYHTLTGTPTNSDVGTTTMTLTASDGQGGSATQSFTLKVINTNDAPVLASVTNVTTNEDTAKTVTLSATDVDGDGDGLTYTGKSNTDKVTISISSTTMTLTPAADWYGTASITAYVSDGTVKDSTSFTLTVASINDVAAINPTTIEEDASATVTLSSTFSGTPTYSAKSDTSAITVSVSSTTLQLTPSSNWNGTSTITAYASVGTFKDSTTFTLSVTAVNDAPVITAVANDSTDEEIEKAIKLSASDIEGDALTYTASSDTSAVAVTISTDTLKLTPALNYTGTSVITVIVSDNALADTSKFDFKVINVNDAPVITAVANDTTSEDSDGKVLKLSASDIEGDALTYSGIADTSAITVTSSNDTLKLIPQANWNGSSMITAIASDGIASDSTTFTLTVTSVNDAPSLLDTTFNEDTSISIVYTIQSGVTLGAKADTSAIKFSMSNNNLSITPDADYFGSSAVTLTAYEGAVALDSTFFTVSVKQIQDAPYAFDWVSTGSDTIDISESNLAETYELKWSESKDVDGETINYLLYAKIGVNPPEEIYDTTSTSVPITYQEFVDNVFEPFPMLPRVTVQFSMEATDGIDTVKITGDNRVLFVNRYEYLSTVSEGIPTEFALHENYPNPFNPTTTLRFDLPELSDMTLTIYNMLGQKVKTFSMQSIPAGYHSVTWDATNDLGQQVGAGVYLYQLQTKDFVKTRKMVLLK